VKTIEQKRAAHAFKAVEAAKELKDEKKKFGVHAHKLPTRIIASGLGQALAFLVAKKYCPLLLQAIAHWTLQKKEFPDKAQLPKADALLLKVIDGSSDDLRRYTAETMAYLQWIVRFAEAAGLTDEGVNP